MTDYLTSLTARHLNPTRGIRPRLPMRFEPARGIGIVSVAGQTDKQKPAAGRRFMTPFPGELPVEEIEREQPEFLSGTKRIPRPSVCHRQEVTATATPAAPQVIPAQETLPGRKSRVLPAPEEPSVQDDVRREVPDPDKTIPAGKRDVFPASSKKPLQRKPGAKPASPRALSEAAVPDDIQKTASGRELPAPEKGNRIEAVTPVAATDESFRPRPAYRHPDPGIPGERRMSGIPGSAKIIIPDGIRRFSRELETSTGEMPVQEPPIQVTIGRIEVRSVSEKEARARRAVPPALDLSDYLQGHTRRGAE